MREVKGKIISKSKSVRSTSLIVFRLIVETWKIDKKIFLFHTAFFAVPAVIPFVNAYIYKLIIDLVVVSVNSSFVDYQKFIGLVSLRFLTVFISDISYYFRYFFETRLETKFNFSLSERLLEKISKLDISFFEDSEYKNKLERVRSSYDWRAWSLLTQISYVFQGLIEVVISIGAIFYLNYWLVFLVITCGLPLLFIEILNSKMNWSIWSQNSPFRKKYFYLTDLLQAAVSVKEIKIFGLRPKFLEEFRIINRKYEKDVLDSSSKYLKRGSLGNLVTLSLSILVEVYVLLSALAKTISVGDIGYYTSVVSRFQGAINGMYRNISRIFEEGLYVGEMFEVLDTKNKIIDGNITQKYSSAPDIEFKNVSFSYPNSKKKIFDNLSLTIKSGEKVAFVGSNGAGKSTLVKLLSRLYDVDDGEILINGVDLRNLRISSWNSALGIIFQDFIKYEYSLKDNISFGKIGINPTMKKIEIAANQSGVDQIVPELLAGYNQMLGKTFTDGVELSIGQWQKVALSRAFYRNAPILIMDEPTASIDAKTEADIFSRLAKLSKNKSAIVISHKFSLVKKVDRIYVIDKGKIVEEGNHESLIKLNGLYAKSFNLQARAYR